MKNKFGNMKNIPVYMRFLKYKIYSLDFKNEN